MKSTGLFLGVLFGLSFLVSGAMLVTATMKPQWFTYGANQAQGDSLRAVAKKDSTAMMHRRDSARVLSKAEVRTDSASTGQAVQTAVKAAPASDVPKAAAAAEQAAPPSSDKENDLPGLVKLYEAMKPEDAAKILSKQADKDVRTIILHIKKKQAALILSKFSADRAAQILAQ